MSTIERSVVIDRPIEEVFRFLHDPRNDSLWQTTLVESTQLDDGPLRIGTLVRERRRFLGVQVEMTKEITEYEPPRRSAFKMVAGGAPMSGEYLLETLGVVRRHRKPNWRLPAGGGSEIAAGRSTNSALALTTRTVASRRRSGVTDRSGPSRHRIITSGLIHSASSRTSLGPCSAERSSVRAVTGKSTTDRRPAATSAA